MSTRAAAAKKKQQQPIMTTPAAQQPAPDPTVFNPVQLAWFYTVLRKDYKYYIAFCALFYAYVLASEPMPVGHAGHAGRYLGSTERFAVTLALAMVALFTHYVDIYLSSPAHPGDRKWHLLLDGFGGHFCYLTVWILTFWSIYWPACGVAEYYWTLHGSENEFARRLVTATYSLATLSSTMGTVLTLLFLKFNWYDPDWRKEIKEKYEERGNHSFKPKILFTHLNQLPIAFFDLLVLKQTDHVLNWATLAFWTGFVVLCVLVLVFLAFTHANYNANGGYYAYPFMDKLLTTWRSEAVFGSAIVFLLTVVYSFYFVMTREADAVEMFLGGFFSARKSQAP